MQESKEGSSAHGQEDAELEPQNGHSGQGSEEDEEESYSDDDAASDASSEALALALATEEAEAEQEATLAPRGTKKGLMRLGSLLHRRADAGQEGRQSTLCPVHALHTAVDCRCVEECTVS